MDFGETNARERNVARRTLDDLEIGHPFVARCRALRGAGIERRHGYVSRCLNISWCEHFGAFVRGEIQIKKNCGSNPQNLWNESVARGRSGFDPAKILNGNDLPAKYYRERSYLAKSLWFQFSKSV
jgi:hypothetical protein